MNGQVVSGDALCKQRVLWHEDLATGDVTLETIVDLTEIIDYNKSLYNSTDERATFKGRTLMAKIPMGLFMQLDRLGITRDDKRFRKWLDDPDNRAFRTRPGKMSK